MASTISVIICAYTEKRFDELISAIESVQRQTLPPEEIVVVIDRNPGLLLRVQESVAGIVAMENHNAKGASGARNSGAAAARGTYLAFLDDDAIAEPDWLERLVACYTGAEIVGVGGKIEPRWCEKRPSWFPEEFNWVVGCSYQGLPGETSPVRNVIGANMSVRRDVMALAGGFREAFGNVKDTGRTQARSKWFQHHAGDEETELCMRVTQVRPGSVWLYTPSAIVQHHVPRQRGRWSYFLWRCYDEGLGKASLVQLHSISTGLSSEKTYTFKTLPRGAARGLADTFLRHEPGGVLRAGAIAAGLTMTLIGYCVGSIFSRVTPTRNATHAPAHHLSAEQKPPVEVQS